jgi:predicted nucleic acid-binding protein
MIVVDILRANSTGKALAVPLGQRSDRPLLSVISVGELLSLAEKWSWGNDRKAALDARLRQLVIVDINNSPVLNRYAAIDRFTSSAGRSMGQNDMWIAATATGAGAVLLTRDQDFDHLAPDHVELVRVDLAGAVVLSAIR